MTQYLMAVHGADDAPPPDPADMEQAFKDVDALNQEMMAAGVWVFGGGLHPVDTATVVRVGANDETLTTDGPFVEAKEHLGGFWIIEAPDLDAALDWAAKATRACREPVEVRPFQDED